MEKAMVTGTEAAKAMLRILLLEDDPADAELCLSALKKVGYQIAADVVDSPEAFQTHLQANPYDVVLSDYRLRSWTGMDALEQLQASGKNIPFVLITGTLGDDRAVECMKRGAADYVLKDELSRLPAAIEQAVRENERRQRAARLQEQIARGKREWELTFDTVPDPVLLLDEDCRVRRANRAAAAVLLEGTPDQLVGRLCYDVVHGQSEPPPHCPHLRLLEEGQPANGDLEEQRLGRVFDVSISPLYQNGNRRGCVYVMHDITERKQAEEGRLRALQLQAENQALARADQMKSEFLANMSHEFRTPLNSILGFSELLLETAAALEPRQREDLEIVYRKAQHLLALVNDLLDLSHIESGQLQLEPMPVVVRDAFHYVLDALSVRLREKGLEGRVEVEPPELCVQADPRRLEQIVTNLVANAIRFTEKGGITLRAQARQSYVLFCVEDTGVGITPEDLGHIFDKFYQVRRQAESAKQGTGLGLAITKQLVELHEGDIWAESTPGQGTRFFFTLSRRPAPAETPPP